ncbi:MAG: hypothetical protein ACI9ON_004307 [Limisphaerales bacterium]|jgi:hypothetical protein
MKIEDLNDAKELDQEESSAIVGGWTLSRYSSSTTFNTRTDFGKISDGTSKTFSYFNWF